MILSNQVRCHKCSDTPFSAHTHDFKSCACGAIAVDGGMSYLRRVGAVRAYDDMSIELPEEFCQIAIEAADRIIHNDPDEYNPLSLFIILAILETKGIVIEGLTHREIMYATQSACYWVKDNGRNGLGALCAVTRYVRDAGGTWKVPADV